MRKAHDPGRRNRSRRHAARTGIVVLAALSLASCTAAGEAHDGVPTGAPTRTIPDAGSAATIALSRALQLNLSTTGALLSVRAPEAVVVVGKDIASSTAAGSLLSAALVFPPLPQDKRCLRRATLRVPVAPETQPGALAAYGAESAASLAGPASGWRSPGAGKIIDVRPRGDEITGGAGERRFDVTELAQVWAQGGPFPSTQRLIPRGSPFVLLLRVPDLTAGTYRAVLALPDGKPSLSLESLPGCPR